MKGGLLLTMTVLGLGRDWGRPPSTNASPSRSLYRLYACLLDVALVTYMISKMVFAWSVRPCDKFMQQLYESVYLTVVVLQRLAMTSQWGAGDNLHRLMAELEGLRGSQFYVGDIVDRYNRYQRWVCGCFASATVLGVAQILKYKSSVVALVPNSKCDVVDNAKFDPTKRLKIEVWLPFDETQPGPHFPLTDAGVSALILVTSANIYLLGVVIPVLVLELCCHLAIAAHLFRTSASIKPAVQYHQQILRVCGLLNKCFHTIIGLKLAGLTLPIIFGIIALIKMRIGESTVGAGGMVHFVIQETIELFVLCWFGEQLTHHSQLAHVAVYLGPWPLMSVGERKGTLLVSAVACHRPARLQVAPRFGQANLQTFIAVSQFSYSLYTILTILT